MPHRIPKAPFHPKDRPANADLKDELRLCIGAMIFCLLIGTAGWMYQRYQGSETHVTAFLVVAGIYAVMAIGRFVKLATGSHEAGGSGH